MFEQFYLKVIPAIMIFVFPICTSELNKIFVLSWSVIIAGIAQLSFHIPVMIKKVGSWIGSIKRYVNSVQNQVTEITDIENDKNETINNNQNANKQKDIDV